MEFEDKWKADALAYIEREHSPERLAYLTRISPHYADQRYDFVEHTTPGGVFVEAVVRRGGKYTERWRMTFGPVVVTSPLDIAFADVTLEASGHEWETYSTVPGWDHSL